MVWADSEFSTLVPANSNFRNYSEKIFKAGDYEKPWFGIEQEYSLLENKTAFGIKPLGWPDQGFPGA